MTNYPTIDRLTDAQLAALYFFQVERRSLARVCGVAGADLDDPQMPRGRVYQFGRQTKRASRRKVKR